MILPLVEAQGCEVCRRGVLGVFQAPGVIVAADRRSRTRELILAYMNSLAAGDTETRVAV